MSLSQRDGEDFRKWLSGETTLSERSRRDVVSRLRRVLTMIDPLEPTSQEELAFKLSQHPDFKRCSMTVRSQLKRAAVLFRVFRRSDRHV